MNNSMLDLSIIILSYNTKQLLKQCLRSCFTSLSKSQLSFEVIVFDNGSDDGSLKMVKRYFSKVRLIESKVNLGYGKANNLAVKSARGRYILLLNSDIIVLGKAVELLYDFVRRNSSVDIAGGRLLNPDMTPQPSCGPFYSLKVVFGMLFLRGDRWSLTRFSPDRVERVDWISGACMCMARKVFENIGGFDEAVFMYMDEIEFLYRAKKLGYLVFFYPLARFIHIGAASSKGLVNPVVNIYRGLLYFYKKHRSRPALFSLRILLLLKALIGIITGVFLQDERLRQSYLIASRLSFS